MAAIIIKKAQNSTAGFLLDYYETVHKKKINKY
jgi:hypothetical protein